MKSSLYYPFHPQPSQTFLINFTAGFRDFSKLAQIPLDRISALATEDILLLSLFLFLPLFLRENKEG